MKFAKQRWLLMNEVAVQQHVSLHQAGKLIHAFCSSGKYFITTK
ncbi:MAG: hypothetical protein R2807_05485 [Chitinophagales bacterium]